MLLSHVAPAYTSSRYAIASCIANVADKRQAPAGTTRAGIDENKVASSLAVRPSGVLCLNPADVANGSVGASQSAGAPASKATLELPGYYNRQCDRQLMGVSLLNHMASTAVGHPCVTSGDRKHILHFPRQWCPPDRDGASAKHPHGDD
ncbi:hypothetical protein VTO73DRAFT_2482 [Trametes versicolor]